ncbi:MAG TPA: 3-deoxy-manno-octulosonate cytidylyltransferase [Gemmatimonadales bacterium]|nr:3-deoxy-manno-octulosonate cytidylyltransferase [Gemmatimonadales bacterium]
MRLLGVIPARLGSTRLPNKPLQLLAGEPLVTRVIARVRQLGIVEELVVATDSPMVLEVVARTDTPAVLTRTDHPSGSDRVAEVAALPVYRDYDVIVNLQGDEPFLSAEALAGAVERVRAGDDIGTAAAPLEAGQAGEPGRVKVVTDVQGRALYFSRAPIPFRRDPDSRAEGLYWQHVGLYAWTRGALERWAAFPPTRAEEAEKLEQLRALEHGLTIGVTRLREPALPGIDTPEDLRRAETIWRSQRG